MVGDDVNHSPSGRYAPMSGERNLLMRAMPAVSVETPMAGRDTLLHKGTAAAS